jgi:hypothetical protein
MRADEVRAAIVTSVEATPVDAKASSQDVFKYLQPGMRDVAMARDRVFTVDIVSPPLRSKRVMTDDLYTCSWDLSVYYSDVPGVQDRLVLDSERLSQKLEALARDSLGIQLVDLSSGFATQTEGQIVVSIQIETVYRLTAGV